MPRVLGVVGLVLLVPVTAALSGFLFEHYYDISLKPLGWVGPVVCVLAIMALLFLAGQRYPGRLGVASLFGFVLALIFAVSFYGGWLLAEAGGSDHEEGLYGDLYSLGVFREIDGRYCIGWPGDYSCNSSPTEDSVHWEETWAHNPVRGLREWFDEYLQERRDERRAELRQSISV